MDYTSQLNDIIILLTDLRIAILYIFYLNILLVIASLIYTTYKLFWKVFGFKFV